MAEDGIVGQYNGSQAREIIISLEQWAEMSGSGSVKPVVGRAAEAQQYDPARPARGRAGRRAAGGCG